MVSGSTPGAANIPWEPEPPANVHTLDLPGVGCSRVVRTKNLLVKRFSVKKNHKPTRLWAAAQLVKF